MNIRLRFAILTRDNFTCRYCGRKAPDVTLEVDHIEPRALGGSDDPRNLITACWDCNHGKAVASVEIDRPARVQHKRMPRTITRRISARDNPFRKDPRFKPFVHTVCCTRAGCEVRMVDLVEGPDGRMYCASHAYDALVAEGFITIHPDPARADDTLEDGSPPASNRAWNQTGKPLRRASAATF